MADRPRVHGFVTPDLAGPATGGTLYNKHLISALQRAGVACRQWTLAAESELHLALADVWWVDSLYLDAMPRLRARLHGAELRLLVHHLPSLTLHGRALGRDELDRAERSALWAADAHLVTGEFMREQLVACGLAAARIVCVEPGVQLPATSATSERARDEAQGLMLSNVVANKGVLALLEALERHTRPDDRFRLRIAGSLEQEPDYASACRSAIARAPMLRGRVELLGALAPESALELLQQSDVLLSASRMESYGMALAEARALGTPIVARAGGNAAAHVDPAAGGILVRDERELSRAWLGLTRDLAGLRERQVAAHANRRARTWDEAAAEFMTRC